MRLTTRILRNAVRSAYAAIALIAGLPGRSQERSANGVPFRLYGFLDASIISADVDEGVRNGPLAGIVLTHNPTGWGACFARQAMRFAGTGPTIRREGWFGSWSIEPEDHVTFHSLMATKEFRTSSPLFRPDLQAGVCFRDVLVHDPVLALPQGYEPHTEKTIGLYARAKALLALSPDLGLEAYVQASFNELRPYSSFGVGLAAGLVRDKALRH